MRKRRRQAKTKAPRLVFSMVVAFCATSGSPLHGASTDATGIPDVSGDGQPDLATLAALTHERGPSVTLFSGVDGRQFNRIDFLDRRYRAVALERIVDMPGTRLPALAVLATRISNHRHVVQIRDLADGALIAEYPTLNSLWDMVDLTVIDDLNGDGASNDPAVAVLARLAKSGKILVQIVRLSDGIVIANRRYLNRLWHPLAIAAAQRNGIPALLAVLAVLPSSNKLLVESRVVSSGAFDRHSRPLNRLWDGLDLATLPDLNGDADIDDPAWLVLARNPRSGANVVQALRVSDGVVETQSFVLNRLWRTSHLATSADLNGNEREELLVSAFNRAHRGAMHLKDFGSDETLQNVLFDTRQSIEVAAKHDLREKKNTHWAEAANANPNQSVIDQMVAIDLDNDDDEDLLVTQSLNPRGDVSQYRELDLVIFRNDGSQFVKEATSISVNVTDAAIDDFNGDGLQDVFISNFGFDDEPFPGGQSRLLIQTGDGKLADLTPTNVPSAMLQVQAVCSGDFDHDGDADLYLAVVNMEHLIYLNNGSGVFSEATAAILPPEMQSTPEPEASFQWCAVEDFNLDGRTDLVLGQQHVRSPEDNIRDALGNVLLDSHVVLYGSEQGALVVDYAKGLLPVTWDADIDKPQVVDMGTADFNRDGCADLLVSSVTSGSVGEVIEDPASNFAVYLGDCDGGFRDPMDYTVRPISESANTLVITDFNHDGFPDFANRYTFDAYVDGGLEVPPVADDAYEASAFINTRVGGQQFSSRKLTRWDVELLGIVGFLGLIHNSLP